MLTEKHTPIQNTPQGNSYTPAACAILALNKKMQLLSHDKAYPRHKMSDDHIITQN